MDSFDGQAETTLIFNLKGKTVVIGSMGKSSTPFPCPLTSENGVSVHNRKILKLHLHLCV